MARVEFDSDGMHFRGGIGKGVYRKVNGKTVLSSRPKRSRQKPPTEKELANQKRFAVRIMRAQDAMLDPKFRAFYNAKAREERKPFVSIPNRDALRDPVIDKLDGSDYGGEPGDVIAIAASDDTGVLGVDVELSSDGRVFESGAAEEDASGWWLYTAQTTVPQGTFVHVEVVARDRPGGTGGASAGIVVKRGVRRSDRPWRRRAPLRGSDQKSPKTRTDGLTANRSSGRVASSPISAAAGVPILPAAGLPISPAAALPFSHSAALPTGSSLANLLDASELLRMARVCAGISQRELARRAGMAQSAISRIEKGLTSPTVETLLRLLHSAGFDVAAELIVRPAGPVSCRR